MPRKYERGYFTMNVYKDTYQRLKVVAQEKGMVICKAADQALKRWISDNSTPTPKP